MNILKNSLILTETDNVCTNEILRDETDWDAVMAIDEEQCIRCGLCVKRCPVDAIKMKRFSYVENLA